MWSKSFSSDPKGQETLVIHCSDHRFTHYISDFLRECLGLASYDLISVPGSAYFFASQLFPKFRWVGRKWLKFFIKHHGTKKIIIFSHHDCGWYKALNLVEKFTDKLFKDQKDDVDGMQRIMSDLLEGISVEHYFVDFDENTVTIKKLGK